MIEVAPVFVSVSVSVELPDRTTFPKLRLAGAEVSAPGAIPVPESGRVREGFDAFDVMVTVPLALPPTCGANVTVNVVLCDGFSESGVVIPLKVNPLPLIAACEMVTAVPPLLVSVTFADCVAPTAMLPKDSLVGFNESCPGAIPVPDSDIVNVGFDAFEVIVTVPLALPAVVGANVTENVVL